MRLHLMPDQKVVDRAITIFEEVFPLDNIYIILLSKNTSMPVFVQKRDKNILFLHYNSSQFWKVARNTNFFTHIIFHFLSIDGVKYLNKIEHCSIYWIEWGSDLYSGLLEQRGYQLYEKKDILWKISSKKIPYFLYKIIADYKRKQQSNKMLNAVKKVHYFVPDSMPDEYPLLLSYYPELSHLEHKNFFYYPIDEILGSELLKEQTVGKNIMVGNSSSPTGNHISVFEHLAQLPLDNQKIIVPLSYGNTRYQKLILQEGHRILKDRFDPIIDFMPLYQYNKLMLSSSIFVYGNLRQEAVGNILIALYLGGKVFLNKKNPLLNFYKSQKIKLFDTDELSEEHLYVSLPDNEKNHNKKILMNLYSKEKLLVLVRENFH